MSDCGKMILYIAETKKEAGQLELQEAIDDIKQFAAYVVSVVAFSQWGLGQKARQ